MTHTEILCLVSVPVHLLVVIVPCSRVENGMHSQCKICEWHFHGSSSTLQAVRSVNAWKFNDICRQCTRFPCNSKYLVPGTIVPWYDSDYASWPIYTNTSVTDSTTVIDMWSECKYIHVGHMDSEELANASSIRTVRTLDFVPFRQLSLVTFSQLRVSWSCQQQADGGKIWKEPGSSSPFCKIPKPAVRRPCSESSVALAPCGSYVPHVQATLNQGSVKLYFNHNRLLRASSVVLQYGIISNS